MIYINYIIYVKFFFNLRNFSPHLGNIYSAQKYFRIDLLLSSRNFAFRRDN